MVETTFREASLSRFLDRVASSEPAPGGGAVAAVAAALAAGLVSMAGRFSTDHLGDAGAVVNEADALRLNALALADRDAAAYAAVTEAYALPKDVDADGRRRQIRAALERATEVPLEIARVATRAAVLGSRLAQGGNQNLKGDALTAVLLATAAARGAATLVEINVRMGRLERDWLERSEAYLATVSGMCGVDDFTG
jgi:formiminotetrahydrofolate cyclodeaminase